MTRMGLARVVGVAVVTALVGRRLRQEAADGGAADAAAADLRRARHAARRPPPPPPHRRDRRSCRRRRRSTPSAARISTTLNRESPLAPVFFALDSFEVIDGRTGASCRRPPRCMRQQSTWQVTVEGHCDERGTAEYNLSLGERRAVAAKTYLVSLGIAAERLRTVSYGKEFPFDPGPRRRRRGRRTAARTSSSPQSSADARERSCMLTTRVMMTSRTDRRIAAGGRAAWRPCRRRPSAARCSRWRRTSASCRSRRSCCRTPWSTLTDALKAVNVRIDEQTGVNRKGFADAKLQADAMGGDIRVVRERVDDTNVRITSLSQEVEALREAMSGDAGR